MIRYFYKEITIMSKKKTSETPQYITVPDAASILGVQKAYIYQLINQGFIPAYRVMPRKTLLIRSELDSYVHAQQI
ncbi:MAG TPA: hypothetical protein DGH14_10760 [Roseburia sp.]|nr:DNA-binding protein [Clostridium sp. OF09-36]HCW30292.1 hypothetical protein [Roseburia sp.]